MSQRRSDMVMRRATLGLALGLLVWIGGLAPLESIGCPHGASRHGVTHEQGLCAWACAAHEPGVIQGVQVCADALPESGRIERTPVDLPASPQPSFAHSRGPPGSI